MARARQYENAAEKQRAYRKRKLIDRIMREYNAGHQRMQDLHLVVQSAAAQGDPLAMKLLGMNCVATAHNLAAHLGANGLLYAQQEAQKSAGNC